VWGTVLKYLMARAWMFNGHGGAKQEKAKCTASMDSWKMRCEGKWSSQGAGREAITACCLAASRAHARQQSHILTHALYISVNSLWSPAACPDPHNTTGSQSVHAVWHFCLYLWLMIVCCVTPNVVITQQMSFFLISHGFDFCSLKLSSSAHTEISLDRRTTPH